MVQGTSRGVGGTVQGRSGLRDFQEVGEGVQGGSASEFLAHRLFES